MTPERIQEVEDNARLSLETYDDVSPGIALELVAHVRELRAQVAAVRHVADTIGGGSTAWETRDRIYEALGGNRERA